MTCPSLVACPMKHFPPDVTSDIPSVPRKVAVPSCRQETEIHCDDARLFQPCLGALSRSSASFSVCPQEGRIRNAPAGDHTSPTPTPLLMPPRRCISTLQYNPCCGHTANSTTLTSPDALLGPSRLCDRRTGRGPWARRSCEWRGRADARLNVMRSAIAET